MKYPADWVEPGVWHVTSMPSEFCECDHPGCACGFGESQDGDPDGAPESSAYALRRRPASDVLIGLCEFCFDHGHMPWLVRP